MRAAPVGSPKATTRTPSGWASEALMEAAVSSFWGGVLNFGPAAGVYRRARLQECHSDGEGYAGSALLPTASGQSGPDSPYRGHCGGSRDSECHKGSKGPQGVRKNGGSCTLRYTIRFKRICSTLESNGNPYKTHTGIEKPIRERRTGNMKLQQNITGNRCDATVPGAKTKQETTRKTNPGRIDKDEVPETYS